MGVSSTRSEAPSPVSTPVAPTSEPPVPAAKPSNSVVSRG